MSTNPWTRRRTPFTNAAILSSLEIVITYQLLGLTIQLSRLSMRWLAALVLALAPLYSVLSLLGVLYLTSRLVYTVLQDLLKLLETRMLQEVQVVLITYWMVLLWAATIGMPFIASGLLKDLFRYYFRSMFGTTYQRLPTSLRALFQTLSRWLSRLPNIFYLLHCSLLDSLTYGVLYSPPEPLKRLGRACRRLLISYTAWLGFTYTILFVFYHRRDALSTVVCATPYVAPQLVLCQPLGLPTPDFLAGITHPRGGLANAVRQVNQDYNLVRPMLGRQISTTLVVLSSYVETIHLPGEDKLELRNAFGSLIEDTDTTVQLFASLTISINDTVSAVRMQDRSTIAVLDRVARETQVQLEPQQAATGLYRVLAAIHPLAGLKSDRSPGLEVKWLIKNTENDFAERIDQLLHEADALLTILQNIHVNLNQIKTLTTSTRGLGNTSAHTVLQDLWVFVAGKKTETEIKGHRKLLGEIPLFYDAASAVVQNAQSSLLQAKAEMKSLDSLPRIRADILLEVCPPQLIAAALRRSAEMLEASTQKFEGKGVRIPEVIAKQKEGTA